MYGRACGGPGACGPRGGVSGAARPGLAGGGGWQGAPRQLGLLAAWREEALLSKPSRAGPRTDAAPPSRRCRTRAAGPRPKRPPGPSEGGGNVKNRRPSAPAE